ncbi:protein-methionine sulfoxide oxidase mical3a-like [Glandiceps talaboti]
MEKKTEDPASKLYDKFIEANTLRTIVSSFKELCEHLDIKPNDFNSCYPHLKNRLTSWKPKTLWTKLDKRASHKDYNRNKACTNTKVLVIGSGPCGLRSAIEASLLGAKVVVVEKRDRFSRNNVLHLWPFVIEDLRSLGAKKFYGKFCAGSVDHISIRRLQWMLLKVALLFGVEIHYETTFEGLVEPQKSKGESLGWKASISPRTHPLNKYTFDVLIGADGKRNTLKGFQRTEALGKLAIAVTVNFINRHTKAEIKVPEISGVAYIFNQKFFQDLKAQTKIDLENIVYYQDETHYFVMTAKKKCLLLKGVLIQDFAETQQLLSRQNINQEALLKFAHEAADFSTDHKLPKLDFAKDHYGQPDVSVFDFTSMYAAQNASRVIERNGCRLLVQLVGDSLLEPFWPTGSGCARGFLGAFDAAWAIKSWASSKSPLEVLAEREGIYRLLGQTTPENLIKDIGKYSIDPKTRYPNHNLKLADMDEVARFYDCGKDGAARAKSIHKFKKKIEKSDSVARTKNLILWCQKSTKNYKNVNVKDVTSSWKSGLALCALIHRYKPEFIDFNSLKKSDVADNNQLAFDIAEREFGISPVMTGKEMAALDEPDKLTMVAYLSQFYEIFKDEPMAQQSGASASVQKESVPSLKSTVRKASLLTKLSRRFRKKDQKEDKQKGKRKSSTPEIMHTDRDSKAEVKISTGAVSEGAALLSYTSYRSEAFNGAGREAAIAELEKSKTDEQSKVTRRINVRSMAGDLDKQFKEIAGIPPKYSAADAEKRPSPQQGRKGGKDFPDSGIQDTKDKLAVNDRGANRVSAIADSLFSQFQDKQTSREVRGHSDFTVSGSDICFFCGKKVYVMERLSAEGMFFHRGCFKCYYCDVTLRIGNYEFYVPPNENNSEGLFCCRQHINKAINSEPRKTRREETKESIEVTPPKPRRLIPEKPSYRPESLNLSADLETDDVETDSPPTPERIILATTINRTDDVMIPEEEVTSYNYGDNSDSSDGSDVELDIETWLAFTSSSDDEDHDILPPSSKPTPVSEIHGTDEVDSGGAVGPKPVPPQIPEMTKRPPVLKYKEKSQRYTEDEQKERMRRRTVRETRREHKQEEHRRLRMAQEIQRHLQEVEVKQKTLEYRGVEIEKSIRRPGLQENEENSLMQDWLNLINAKNDLVRFEQELTMQSIEMELEDRQTRLQEEIREKLEIEDAKKTKKQRTEEKKLLQELVDVVDQRNNLVMLLEEQRLQEQEEDKDFETVMLRKGFDVMSLQL